MTAELATITAPADLPQDLDVSHEVCCIDEETATDRVTMCGLPISDDEELDEETPTCVVCQDLLEQWAHNADTYGEDPYWPSDPPCRLCPRRQR